MLTNSRNSVNNSTPNRTSATPNRNSVNMGTPLQSFSNPGIDADRMQKDHHMEVQRLQEEKKRLEGMECDR